MYIESMKKLLFTLILFASSSVFAQFGPSQFGGLEYCQAPIPNQFPPVIPIPVPVPMPMPMPTSMPMPSGPSVDIDPTASIDREIEDLQEQIRDLKRDRRTAKKRRSKAERQHDSAQQQMLMLGCTGGITGETETNPAVCLMAQMRVSKAETSIGDAEDIYDEIGDELSDLQAELSQLESRRSDIEIESQRTAMQTQTQPSMPQSGNLGMGGNMGSPMGGMGTMNPMPSTPTLPPAGQAPQLIPLEMMPTIFGANAAGNNGASFSSLQGGCPSCMVQPQYGATPMQSIGASAYGMGSILNQFAPQGQGGYSGGYMQYISEQNARLGWTSTPGFEGGYGSGRSVFGPGNNCWGQPPMYTAGLFPGGAVSPLNSPFQNSGIGQPMMGAPGFGTSFPGAMGPQNYAR